MIKDKRIIDEVEKTIHSMDNLEILESNPFLYTRLQAEIGIKNIKQAPAKSKTGAVLKPVLFLIIILFNLFTAVYYLYPSHSAETRSNSITSLSKIISQEYGFNKNYYIQFSKE